MGAKIPEAEEVVEKWKCGRKGEKNGSLNRLLGGVLGRSVMNRE